MRSVWLGIDPETCFCNAVTGWGTELALENASQSDVNARYSSPIYILNYLNFTVNRSWTIFDIYAKGRKKKKTADNLQTTDKTKVGKVLVFW